MAKLSKVRANPALAWAVKMGDTLDVLSISDDKRALLRQINRPAGQSVVRVRITELPTR